MRVRWMLLLAAVMGLVGGCSTTFDDPSYASISIAYERTEAGVNVDRTPPEIVVLSPDTRQQTVVPGNTKNILVEGEIKDASGIVDVTVDHQPASLDAAGRFAAVVNLAVGDNTICIAAMDRYQNRSERFVSIFRNAVFINATEQMVAKPPVAVTVTGHYYALIIAVEDYQFLRKLKTPNNDAVNLRDLLETRYGFDTTLLLNPTRFDILRELNLLRKNLEKNDSLLIYYAGHGFFDDVAQKAYWLPVDAMNDDNTNWIIVDSITTNIKKMVSDHVLVISDSCYSGTLARGVSIQRESGSLRNTYLSRMGKKRSRTLLASGGNEPVNDSGGTGHSVFALNLLTALQTKKEAQFSAEELYHDHIKEQVVGGSEQTPEYSVIRNSGHEGGDFVFVRRQ